MKFNAYVRDEFKDCISDIVETYKSYGVEITLVLKEHGIISGTTNSLSIDDLKNSAISFVEEVQEIDPTQIAWIENAEPSKPEKAGYYFVKFEDGTMDEKPYRIRNGRSGFLSDRTITHWAEIPENYDGNWVEID